MKVLIVEDDTLLSKNMKRWFEHHENEVTTAMDGASGLRLALENAYDVIILDLMLPELGGWAVLHKLRQQISTPVLVLSAVEDTHSKIRALNDGADDFQTKPFHMDELLARTRALARRNNAKRNSVKIGDYQINLNKRTVSREENLINLTPTEFSIVECLTLSQGKAVPRFNIIESINNAGVHGNLTDSALDVHISAIRKKTEKSLIETLRGTGYIIR